MIMLMIINLYSKQDTLDDLARRDLEKMMSMNYADISNLLVGLHLQNTDIDISKY